MKRIIITICVAIFVFSIFVGQDSVVAQVTDCADCDDRFVNEKGDTIRKLKVKRDLTVKRNLFVDGKVGIGTASPAYELDVSGTIRGSRTSLGVGVIGDVTDGTGVYGLARYYRECTR